MSKKDTSLEIPESVSKAVAAIAKGIGVAAGELWGIFVRQYFVRGITEAFTGAVLSVASYFLYPFIGLWILAPLLVALGFFYGAILLIGNPKYYALADITKRIQELKNPDAIVESRGRRYYY